MAEHEALEHEKNDWPERKVSPDETAITLSGGGYRAMLFHLGFLWRLRDAGILGTIDRCASVSGGSITAGMLARRWEEIDWNDDGQSFRTKVADPIMTMSQQSIDIVAGLLGRIPGLNGSWVTRAYNRVLYGGTRLIDLPEKPRFIFNATSLHSGKLVRMEKVWIADYTLGHWDTKGVRLADAVAASSAFPPVLSPVTIKLAGRRFTPFPDGIYKDEPPEKLFLTDGGVYDNLGVESVWKQCGTVFVSNAGANFRYRRGGSYLLSSQALQVTFIMQDQVGALRFRRIWDSFHTSDPVLHREGFLVSSDYFIEPRPDGGIPYNRALAERLAATPTRLTRIDPAWARKLVNWGYAATDDRIRESGRPTGLCKYPYPEDPLD
ncbi:patatin-like phospholipase family protein [Novosphingobium beihaiensis]|uniref:Patatin-like phospholipase family protein n=1 Tax=Novosphingobium beihaiensis TaxID=2930389 RepID=A0ABT0BP73_9SPHN|nr:patatin-like phospholipase family protein [Novosphingobium beihaiensis]MCJ2186509.1 patatin-like phospholipase family protein [Novosphingobium beihaiensis]